MSSVNQYIEILNEPLRHRIISHYKKNATCYLSELCDKYGSDKGELTSSGHPYPWPAHTYADYYSRLFSHCRPHIRFVFECGLGTNNPDLPSSMGVNGKPGASLRVWRDYFSNAQVFGADIDKDVLFEEERIKTYFVDQTSPKSIEYLWTAIDVLEFDLIVDDGLHTYDAGICMFENSISKLAKNGIYIIEDVSPCDLLTFRDYFESKPYQVDFINLLRPNLSLADNNIVLIRNI